MKNLWRSIYTGKIYAQDTNFMPQFGGWQLLATVPAENVDFERAYFKAKYADVPLVSTK